MIILIPIPDSLQDGVPIKREMSMKRNVYIRNLELRRCIPEQVKIDLLLEV